MACTAWPMRQNGSVLLAQPEAPLTTRTFAAAKHAPVSTLQTPLSHCPCSAQGIQVFVSTSHTGVSPEQAPRSSAVHATQVFSKHTGCAASLAHAPTSSSVHETHALSKQTGRATEQAESSS